MNIEESGSSFGHFVSNVCAIVGGTFTVRFLHRCAANTSSYISASDDMACLLSLGDGDD